MNRQLKRLVRLASLALPPWESSAYIALDPDAGTIKVLEGSEVLKFEPKESTQFAGLFYVPRRDTEVEMLNTVLGLSDWTGLPGTEVRSLRLLDMGLTESKSGRQSENDAYTQPLLAGLRAAQAATTLSGHVGSMYQKTPLHPVFQLRLSALLAGMGTVWLLRDDIITVTGMKRENRWQLSAEPWYRELLTMYRRLAAAGTLGPVTLQDLQPTSDDMVKVRLPYGATVSWCRDLVNLEENVTSGILDYESGIYSDAPERTPRIQKIVTGLIIPATERDPVIRKAWEV